MDRYRMYPRKHITMKMVNDLKKNENENYVATI